MRDVSLRYPPSSTFAPYAREQAETVSISYREGGFNLSATARTVERVVQLLRNLRRAALGREQPRVEDFMTVEESRSVLDRWAADQNAFVGTDHQQEEGPA